MAKTISAALKNALARHQAGDLRLAEKMYRSMLSRTPKDAGILNLLGAVLFQKGQLPDADEKTRLAINLDPLDATFHFNLGNIKRALGESDRAEASYRLALELKPYYPEATQNLCNLLNSQKRYEAAAILFQKAIQLNPSDIDARFSLALASENMGDWANAVHSYQQILSLQPDKAETRHLYAKSLKNYAVWLLSNKQPEASHAMYLRLLEADPADLSALHMLTAIERHSTQLSEHLASDDKIDLAIKEISRDHYANALCSNGWLFSALIDYQFFDSQLTRLPVQRHPASRQSYPETQDIDQAANDHLERICRHADATSQYAALEELTLLNTPSLTQDSFAGLTEVQYQQEIRHFFSGGKLNVLVIGAGPVGLALASALKVALQENVNVLLVENRVASLHHKLPYDRIWITNLPSSLLHGLVENSISNIFAKIGNGIHMGCTINILESLLLLSCRRMGVKFLFAERCDYSFIEDSSLQLVLDASGNRFQPPQWPPSTNEITVRHNMQTDTLDCKDSYISPFGIRIHNSPDNRHITLGTYKNLIIPLYKNQPIKLALLKLVHVPFRHYGVVANFIAQHNEDNKYYVWRGTLNAAINQLIIIISLDKTEYEYLCKHHVFPLNPAEALNNEAFRASLDERTCAILKMLTENAQSHDQTSIDAPFLYEPHLVDYSVPEQLHGRPVIRVGDSVFNGNVKFGNGLGAHLQNVRTIQTVLKKFAR